MCRERVVVLLMYGLVVGGCAAPGFQRDTNSVENLSEVNEEKINACEVSETADCGELNVLINAFEEQFDYIMYVSRELSLLLNLEGGDEFGLTRNQNRLSGVVETDIFSFLINLEKEMGQVNINRNAELIAWSALRWGQMHANYVCLLIDIKKSSRHLKHFPRAQHQRLNDFNDETGHYLLSWVSFLERAANIGSYTWSELARSWLELFQSHDDGMLRICSDKVAALRRNEEVGLIYRREGCNAGYNWMCEWVESVLNNELVE